MRDKSKTGKRLGCIGVKMKGRREGRGARGKSEGWLVNRMTIDDRQDRAARKTMPPFHGAHQFIW